MRRFLKTKSALALVIRAVSIEQKGKLKSEKRFEFFIAILFSLGSQWRKTLETADLNRGSFYFFCESPPSGSQTKCRSRSSIETHPNLAS